MKYRFFSDLHLERDAAPESGLSLDAIWTPKALDDDQDTILVLAGDLWNGTRALSFEGFSWIEKISARFKSVIVVLGNHDYWSANWHTLSYQWRGYLEHSGFLNVHLLELGDGVDKGSVVIDGVRFLGGTLWTDMDKGSPLVTSRFDSDVGPDGRPIYNDRNFIAINGRGLTSVQWIERHRQTRANLLEALKEGDEPVVLVTHHAPCLRSAPIRYQDVMTRYLYGSDLSELLLSHSRIKMAIHGHTHIAHDYMVGDVRVRCNPRGYSPGLLVPDFSEVVHGVVSAEILLA